MRRKREKNQNGYVTVFTVVLLSVFLVFVFFMLELVCLQLAKHKTGRAVSANIVSLFGDFNPELFEKYHLLGVDATYQTETNLYLEQRMLQQLQRTVGGGMFALRVEDVSLQEQQGFLEDEYAQLKKQLEAYGGYHAADSLLSRLKEQDVDTNPEMGTVPEEVFSETAVLQNPVDFLSGLTGNGLLQLVCPQGAMPSQAAVALDGLPSSQCGTEDTGQEAEFDWRRDAKSVIQEGPFAWEKLQTPKAQLALLCYMDAVCSDYVHAAADKTIRCEQEYILYGNASDRDNLLKTVHGLIRLRLPFAYLYLKQAVGKQIWIQSASAVLAGVTGVAPAAMQEVLTMAVCYAESLLDVRALLHGEPVPLKKTDASWRLQLSGLFQNQLLARTTNAQTGFYYTDYLKLLMLAGGVEDRMYARLLDVITWNMQEEDEQFSFSHIITKARLVYHVSTSPRFAGLIFQWDAQAYHFVLERELGYDEE